VESEQVYYQRELEYIGTITHELAHHLLLKHDIVAPPGPDHDWHAH